MQAAYGDDGKPTKAAEGFAKSCGVAVTDLRPAGTCDGAVRASVAEGGVREGELHHGIWSGPETYLMIDPSIRIAPENQTFHTEAGDIGYYEMTEQATSTYALINTANTDSRTA